MRLEGIVAKHADSPYRRGRSGDWVKIKTGAGRAIDEGTGKVERALKLNPHTALLGVITPRLNGF